MSQRQEGVCTKKRTQRYKITQAWTLSDSHSFIGFQALLPFWFVWARTFWSLWQLLRGLQQALVRSFPACISCRKPLWLLRTISGEVSLSGFHEIGCTCYAHSMKITSCWLFTFYCWEKKVLCSCILAWWVSGLIQQWSIWWANWWYYKSTGR